MLWRIFSLLMIALCLAGAAYLITRFHRFSPLRALAERHRLASWLLAAVPVAALGCFGLINVTTLGVVALHLLVVWPLCDLIGRIIERRRGKRFRRYWPGVAALAVCALYLSVGWYCAHSVAETHYTFTTDKPLDGGSLRVVAMADCHLGITQDGESFARLIDRVQAAEPDVVVIVGDFVDDDTGRTDMLRACEALGTLETRLLCLRQPRQRLLPLPRLLRRRAARGAGGKRRDDSGGRDRESGR